MADWLRRPDQIYFLKPRGMTGPIRIGTSCNPQKRFRSYNSASPFPLELLVIIPGGWSLENNIHEVLADIHSHGEWFFASAKLCKIVEDLQAGVPIEEAMDLTKRVGSTRKKRRLYTTEANINRPVITRQTVANPQVAA